MNNTHYQIIAFMCFLFSCTSTQKERLPTALVRAESLMYAHPDSALALLESMPVPPATDKLQNATWCLLLVQAQDKNNVRHTSDSLIRIAHDYFMKQKDMLRKALVLNYEGRVNEDLGEIEKATLFYLQASDAGKQTDDYRLRFLIESNLGTIYLYRSLHKEAMEALLEANALALQTSDAGYISSSYAYLGRAYSVLSKWDKAIDSYKQAEVVAEQSNKINALNRAYGELATVYKEMGEYDSSLVYLRKDEALVVPNKQNRMHQTYLRVGSLFAHTAVYDSAIYYLNKSLTSHKLYTKQSAYRTLSSVFEKQGNTDEALCSMKLFLNVQDSIQKQGERKDIAEIQARYNHEKMKNANAQLELEKSRTIKIALCLLLILMGAVAYILYVYQRKLLQKERMIQEKKELLEHNILQLHKTESEIRANESHISFLSGELKQNSDRMGEKNAEIEDLNEKNRQLIEESGKLKEAIKATTPAEKHSELLQAYQNLCKEHEQLSNREQMLYEKLLKQIPELKQLCETPKFIAEEQWTDVEGWIGLLSEGFANRLRKQIPEISENDIQFCYLIKLGFSNAAIGTLIGISTSAITKRKQRMKESMLEGLKEQLAKNHAFDEWIKRL